MKSAIKRNSTSANAKRSTERSTASNSKGSQGGHGSQMTAHQQGKASSVSGTRGKGESDMKGKS